jgi:methionyl-tRNA formyltransferase
MILGAEAVLSTARLIERGETKPQTQNDDEATPAPKIFREQCAINWTKPVREVHNFIRGRSPIPGAFTHHGGNLLKIYRTRICSQSESGPSGMAMIENDSLKVFAGLGTLEVLELQQEGKKRMFTADFLKGFRTDQPIQLK